MFDKNDVTILKNAFYLKKKGKENDVISQIFLVLLIRGSRSVYSLLIGEGKHQWPILP